MKATGIVRRVDDLGRVAIPKEIRHACNIREGDPLEIFLQDGAVVFKKYNPTYRDDLMATLQDAQITMITMKTIEPLLNS